MLAGTFVLRFSTGLTGAMLQFYLGSIDRHSGHEIRAELVGLYAAIFYVSELVLSPLFGILSDRFGHHRIMIYGPIFGGAAVVLTALTSNLTILGASRLLQGSSTAASIPSILGFLALVTAGDEVLRGKAAARFEGATLVGLGAGFIVAPKLFEALGSTAFFLNALVYGLALAIFLFWVKEPAPAHGGQAPAREPFNVERYVGLLRSSHVWLLAPTWIAVNAAIGLWFSQSLFQFSRSNPRFPDQMLMRGFDANQITIGAIIIAAVFAAGLIYWGNRFKNLRRTTIIFYGVVGGGALVLGGLVVNHAATLAIVVLAVALIVAAAGLFVLAGATPAALGLLADISERFPSDRGAIMGLYSVFLAIGQIVGSLIGGYTAQHWGIDGMLFGTGSLLLVALIPLARLRSQEHELETEGRVPIVGRPPS